MYKWIHAIQTHIVQGSTEVIHAIETHIVQGSTAH